MSSTAPFKAHKADSTASGGFQQSDFDALLIEAVRKREYVVVSTAIEAGA